MYSPMYSSLLVFELNVLAEQLLVLLAVTFLANAKPFQFKVPSAVC